MSIVNASLCVCVCVRVCVCVCVCVCVRRETRSQLDFVSPAIGLLCRISEMLDVVSDLVDSDSLPGCGGSVPGSGPGPGFVAAWRDREDINGWHCLIRSLFLQPVCVSCSV